MRSDRLLSILLLLQAHGQLPSSDLAARLEVGTAWVNQHRTTSATVPFGGAKESGIVLTSKQAR